ncbi:pyridoxal phosphate-dependent decarboxylase family protein [Longimicrobium sp.]|uniref:pyridoxal phosphate-dependent decarboxylase family protein n=1 Tax=Longimicrobium sp. TaxID=2029185 RepID=UPI002E344E8E|nr:pyridoxal-dependent decarboxylase [Longimicrobium sp.]HEX6040503.1 pyridoxal-dependent decarboxylase [Longimicrobium sp.]
MRDPKETDPAHPPEATLDPADWDAFRALAHRMVDDTVEYLATLRERAPWQPMPPTVRDGFDEPLPRVGEGEAAAYEQFRARVQPYPNGNLHPRFWGWVQGNGTPLGMMADMLAAAMNPHLAGFNQAPARVEHQVIRWLAQLMGFPADAGGVLVTGGTMANLLGLNVARHARAGWDVRKLGMEGGPRLTVYGASETHGWIRKAVELMGMGHRSYRPVAVDEAYRIDLDALAAAVREDRAAGHRPLCVIGTAGTVNTGATDDLAALADFCAAEGLWFHVDGAFGAWAYTSDALRPMVAGMERADSLGFDLHKWGYLPFECACVLVRDPALHRAAFASAAPYLAVSERGVTAGGLPFADRGVDLTRGFKALKVWMSFKAHGVDALVRLVEQNVAQARYLAARVEASPSLELVAPVPLNVVCFRYAPADLPEAARNAVNEEILLRLQEGGIAVPSGTTLGGRFAIRCAIVNHRSRRADFDALVEAVERIGREVVEGR